jgi:hypothetical protein
LTIPSALSWKTVAIFIALFSGLTSGCGGSDSPKCSALGVTCGDTRCHYLINDPANCGACGNACAADQVCSRGACASTCAADTVACSGACVDLMTDVDHCGACGNICTSANGSPACVNGACTVAACDAGFYANGTTCQACAAACSAGQYQTADCTSTTNRSCASCTVIANCAAETCTTSAAQVCTACSAGFYLSGNACVACSTGACPSGEYQTAACSATADRTCAACTAIANCTAATCTTSSDQVCSACGVGNYASGGTCLACSGACAPGQYQASACGATADRTCASCTAIPNCTAATCTTSADQVCAACDAGFFLSGNACVACSSGACPSGQYQSAACSATADRTCAACTAIANCTAATCTTASDQVCSACSAGNYASGGTCHACSGACASGQYQASACGATTDRTCAVCAAVSTCAAVTCTTSSDQVCSGCASGSYLSGNACVACSSGACPASEIETVACSATADRTCGPPPDCYALHVASPSLPDGSYTIDPDGAGGADAFPAYCDMTSGGGGWTLLMKIDGTKTTFTYSSAYWTSSTSYQPTEYAYDAVNETKLSGFNSMPLQAVRIGMNDPTDTNTRWLEVPRVNSSLAQLFSGAYQATSLGRDAWEGLMSSPSLQANCNLEGFNTSAAGTSARIGILGNQENDCNSPDSRIGIGTSGANCGQNTNHSSGDEAYCTPDHGNRSTATFGYVMVRACPGGICACGTLTSCDALCVDLQTNKNACGSCGTSCGSQNATGTCSNGACTEVCTPGFTDCDKISNNGCEANLNSDVNNCGACGTTCGAHQVCTSGTCTDLPALTVINPNGHSVEYLPRSWGNGQDPAEGTCTTGCVVYPTKGNSGQIRLRAPNGIASGCNSFGNGGGWGGGGGMGHCYVSLPATIVLN